jgi:hypothetical protein
MCDVNGASWRSTRSCITDGGDRPDIQIDALPWFGIKSRPTLGLAIWEDGLQDLD